MTRIGSDDLVTRVIEERRLTLLYCDLVGSTELSGRLEPEAYRDVLRRYRALCREVIEARFGGHVVHEKGDGALSAFGFPVAHENDAERAVRAGLALVRAVRGLGADCGEPLAVRVGVHKGPVLIELADDDVHGLAANVGSRFEQLADPGTVVISAEVQQLVAPHFVFEARALTPLKGVADPVPAFRVVVERSAPARVWASPLVEREAELARLQHAYAAIDADPARPTAVLITGDAGVGKSRLLAALDAPPAIALYGSPLHTDESFHPFQMLIETRAGIGPDAAPEERLAYLTAELDAHQVGDRLPLIAPILGLDPNAGYQPAAAEGRTLADQVSNAVFAYVVACLGDGPAVLCAEDVHFFDESSVSLLAGLTRVGPGRLLVVATSRRPVPGRWETVALQPLSDQGSMTLVSALAPGLAEEQRRALADRSNGIPFFVEELARARPAVADGTVGLVPGSVPEPLYEPLVAHLYAAPDALPVAAVAAAAGTQPERALIAAALELPDEELDAALARLVDIEVLTPSGDRFRFRHELLREVAYELQPPSWRRRVHDRLADVLHDAEHPDWRVLASHLERAERWREAAAAYQETAEWARRLGAIGEARTDLTRALDLLDRAPADPDRDHQEIQLRLRRGYLTMSDEGGASPRVAADFERCHALAAADPQGDDMFSTLISLWAYYLARAELDRSRALSVTLRTALDGVREVFRAGNRAGFGTLDWFAGRFDDAVETMELANRELDERGGEDEVLAAWFVPNDQAVAMRVHLGLARFVAGDLDGARAAFAHARARADRLDFPHGPWSMAYACWLETWMWAEAGRPDRVASNVAELGELSERHGFESWQLVVATQATVLEGESAEAVDALLELWQAAGLRILLPYYVTAAGGLHAVAGDAASARARYDASLALAAETGMRFYDAETRRRLAHLDPDPEPGLRSALALARSQGALLFERRIEADLRT